MATLRTVTGTVLRPDGSVETRRIRFELIPGSYDATEQHPSRVVMVTPDPSTGAFSVQLWPNEGGVDSSHYVCTMPDGDTFKFTVPTTAGPFTLSALRELGVTSSDPQFPTLLSVLRIVDVKLYGAVGDGVADDTAAIQAAHTAAIAGDMIYFPNGTYKVTSSLSFTKADITYQFASQGAIIRASTAAFNVITLGSAAHRSRFQGGCIQGPATTNGTTQFGIYTNALAAPDDVTVSGTLFSGATAGVGLNNGIKIDGGNRWKVRFCTFERLYGNISGTGYGVLGGTTNRLIAFGNTFTGTAGRGRHAVYLSGGCTYCVVKANLVDAFDFDGLVVYSTSGQAANVGNVLSTNTITSGGSLVALSAAISILGKSSRNRAVNNKISGYQGHGVIVTTATQASTCEMNVVAANDVYGVHWHGVYVEGATKTSVRGNDIHDVSQASSGTYAAVTINVDGAVVADKTRVIGNVGMGATLRAGLWIQAATVTGTVATGNTFPDGTVRKIITSGAPLRAWNNDVGLNHVGADQGDTSPTVIVSQDSEILRFATALTANRTVTLSTTDAYEGARFRVVRTGLGAFTLDVGGLKTVPSGTAAFVDVMYNGSAWILTGYGTL